MSELLASLAVDPAADDRRQALLEAARRDGLPGKRVERWKYTSLLALGQRRFATAAAVAVDAAALAHVPSPRVVFVNGRHAPALSDLRGLPAHVTVQTGMTDASPRDDGLDPGQAHAAVVFERLNAALAGDALQLRVEAATGAGVPVHLVHLGAAAGTDVAWHARSRIELAAGAALTLIEHHLGDAGQRHLGTTVQDIQLADGAELAHLRIQREAAGASIFAHTHATLAADASYRRLDLELGAALSRHELKVALAGARASLEAHGVLLATGTRHLDTRIGIEHRARDTRCALTWRGMAGDRGRAVFHGGIVIQPGADGSDARLSSKNLLLSPGAEVDAQPVLEIHADEVKAAHGATVGQLDERAVFYLRSRGIDPAQARRMLTAAFCRQVLAAIGDEARQAPADTALAAALADLEQSA